VAAPDAVAGWGVPQGRAGRIVVGPDLRVQGSERIFAAGDIAMDPDNPSPQLAQPALQEGAHIAKQIKSLLRGGETQPFSYHDKGLMATIGRRSAVVELPKGPRFTGTLAWLAWLVLHLFYLLGFRNRISTLINLSWRYIAWGRGGGVIVGDEPSEPLPSETQGTLPSETCRGALPGKTQGALPGETRPGTGPAGAGPDTGPASAGPDTSVSDTA
jgi:NADH dehydrogenase